ncbi:MAG: Proline-rich protein [Polyangiaceae bacterium]|nr:Proline-rich protein [Polyangiaceae bacterium]
MNCSRCGRENPDGLKFCQDCGNRLNAPAPAAASPVVAPPAAPAPAAPVVVPPVQVLQRAESVPRPSAPAFQFNSPAPAPTAASEKRCLRCGTSNPHQGRFCANCGSPLPGSGHKPDAAVAPAPPTVVACPRCRGSNNAQMAFCQFCGARLSEGASGAPGGAAPPATGPAPGSSPGGSPFSPQGVGTSFQFASQRPEERAKLVVIGQDGKPGREYEIDAEQTDVGREEGSILLVNDPYVSPRHARLQFRDGRFFIRDLESVNGVYVRLRAPERLQHADLVLVGLEVLRFEIVSDAERGLGPAAERGTQVFGSPAAPRYARLCQRTVEGVTRDVYYPTREETVIGREVGDVVFTTDPFMSRRHAAIVRDPGTNTFSLKDLGSSNGTYLGIRGERELVPGDHVRIGQHLFRLDFGTGSRAR